MSSSNSSTSDPCSPDDNLCIVREHQPAVIIVPTLLIFFTLVVLLILFLRLYCCVPQRRTHSHTHRHRHAQVSDSHRHTHRQTHTHRHTQQDRHRLQGIDAPPGINPLEHEQLPMSVQNKKPTMTAVPQVATERQHGAPPLTAVPQVATVRQHGALPLTAVPQLATERQHGAFSQVVALPLSFSIKPTDSVSLYRGRMEDRDVVLRVLKESASSSEQQHFLSFAYFLSNLGPHPFLPTLLGVVSVRPPLMMVMEELHHRDLLSFLWRCRQDSSGSDWSCDLTEKRIFIMAGQVASALDHLHNKGLVHGNLGARSVLVGSDLRVKLWGLGSAYRRNTWSGSVEDLDYMELRKWQAPEVLARRGLTTHSDLWSFGILLFEMITLGEPPFAELMATGLLQHLQRGKHLRRPHNCSNTLYAIIRSCCHWTPHKRPSVAELSARLEAGERSANGRTVLRTPDAMDIGRYLREAGFGEAYNYAVL